MAATLQKREGGTGNNGNILHGGVSPNLVGEFSRTKFMKSIMRVWGKKNYDIFQTLEFYVSFVLQNCLTLSLREGWAN